MSKNKPSRSVKPADADASAVEDVTEDLTSVAVEDDPADTNTQDLEPDAADDAAPETDTAPESDPESEETQEDAPSGQNGPATAPVAPAPAVEPTPIAPSMPQTAAQPMRVDGSQAVPIAERFPTNTEYKNAEGEIDTAKGEYMNALVIAHFLEDMKGCVTLKIPYEFKKHSQWRVPRWFALMHPKKMVLRG